MKVAMKTDKGARLQFSFTSEDYPKGKNYIFNNAVSGYNDDQLTTFAQALDMLVEGSLSDEIAVLATTKVIVEGGTEQPQA
ncbi:DUF1659 domain-containing protein [Limosilactobacillus rudii]|uniref:DUF1659 domain-containing protein n=1 Tax=Limosilactobacillus rudii TaxID=2759755 RepID=UPI0015F9BC22|nr:hypothetical protein [Limosilactobacillus rudii]MBB1078304.1 hypothetical protein [Limosilactobacillus rudii]